MSNLWKGIEKLEVLDGMPKELIEQQCDELNKATFGKIIARLEPIENVPSGTAAPILAISGLLTSMSGVSNEEAIQASLGDSESYFNYEFYVTSRKTPNYKYRVFFLRHRALPYPLEFFLEKSIATEKSLETKIICNTQADMMEVLGKIFGSNRLKGVIQSLLAMNRDPELQPNTAIQVA